QRGDIALVGGFNCARGRQWIEHLCYRYSFCTTEVVSASADTIAFAQYSSLRHGVEMMWGKRWCLTRASASKRSTMVWTGSLRANSDHASRRAFCLKYRTCPIATSLANKARVRLTNVAFAQAYSCVSSPSSGSLRDSTCRHNVGDFLSSRIGLKPRPITTLYSSVKTDLSCACCSSKSEKKPSYRVSS